MDACLVRWYVYAFDLYTGKSNKKRLLNVPFDLDLFVILLDHSGHSFLLSAFFVFFYCSYVFTMHQFRYLCAPTSRRVSTVVCLMGKVRFFGEQLLHVSHLDFRDR